MNKIKQSFSYIIIFLVSYLIYVYPFDVINYLLIDESLYKVTSIFFTLFIYLIVIFYFKTKNTFFLFKILVHEGMGVGFISFWIANIYLIINLISTINPFYLGIACISSIFLVCGLSYFLGGLIRIRKIKIISSKISKRQKLLFISDVHLGSNSTKYLQKLCMKINSLEFDLLLIGGDLIDSSNFKIENLKIMKDIRKPILFVTGNHEYYLKDYKSKLKLLKNNNINFLNNKSYLHNEINIIGISDNQSINEQKFIVHKSIKNNLFNLVLIHKPSLWEKVNEKTDLMLCGHTHNGQIFPFNFFVKLKYANIYGLYEKLNSKLYVSSGAGCWGPKMRLGSQNEIVELILISN